MNVNVLEIESWKQSDVVLFASRTTNTTTLCGVLSGWAFARGYKIHKI